MEYTKEQIQEMAKIEANDKKHEHVKLDYQDGIYYGFQQGFEKALSLFSISVNEVKFCEYCQKLVKPPKCNHCGNEDLIPDWTS